MFLSFLLSVLDGMWLLAGYISGKSSFPKPLNAEDESLLIARHMRGDSEAREKLIVHNLRLVAHIAKKYISSGYDMDDLVSIGSIGLIKAVNTYRPEAGKLTSYSARCIENEILMHLRSGKKSRGVISLNDSIGSDGDGNEIRVIDMLGTDADEVPQRVEISIESSRAVEMLDSVLDKREKQVVLLRCGLLDGSPRHQHEVAKLMGISRSYVSRIEKRAFGKLKTAMETKNPPS